MHSAGNVVFPDADSASKAIQGLGTVAPPEEAPDGFGEGPHSPNPPPLPCTASCATTVPGV